MNSGLTGACTHTHTHTLVMSQRKLNKHTHMGQRPRGTSAAPLDNGRNAKKEPAAV